MSVPWVELDGDKSREVNKAGTFGMMPARIIINTVSGFPRDEAECWSHNCEALISQPQPRHSPVRPGR